MKKAKDFKIGDIINFNLRLHNPSKLSELQELEHFKSQLDIAGSAKENGFFFSVSE